MGIDRKVPANERDKALQPIDFKGNTQLPVKKSGQSQKVGSKKHEATIFHAHTNNTTNIGKVNAGWSRGVFLSFPAGLGSVAQSQLLQTAGVSLAERADR